MSIHAKLYKSEGQMNIDKYGVTALIYIYYRKLLLNLSNLF